MLTSTARSSLRKSTQNPLTQLRLWSWSRSKSTRPVLTLDPNKLVQLSQPAVDIAGLVRPHLKLTTGKVEIIYASRYTRKTQRYYSPFPENTRGFIYYHRPADRPPISGEIRFRVTPSDDPASFSYGHDLLRPSRKLVMNDIWRINLLSLPTPVIYQHFLTSLVDEGLVETSLLECLHKASASTFCIRDSRILYTLSDPFRINYADHPGRIFLRVITEAGQYRAGILVPYYRAGKRMKFKSGAVKVRLERSTLPEHEGKKILVMRCLEVIEPVVIEPLEESPFKMGPLDIATYTPIPGELMRIRGPLISLKPISLPWSLDISDGSQRIPAPGLRVLW